MTREQMIAWLTLEGWVPTSDGDMRREGTNLVADTHSDDPWCYDDGGGCFGSFGSASYHAGENDVSWDEYLDAFGHHYVAAIYRCVSGAKE
jgi:hypothetical protein